MALPPDPTRYAAYCFLELLDDPYFQQWVRNPSAESDAFFTAFRVRYPHKAPDLADAHELFSFLSRLPADRLHPAEVKLLWHRINQDAQPDAVSPDWVCASGLPATGLPLVNKTPDFGDVPPPGLPLRNQTRMPRSTPGQP